MVINMVRGGAMRFPKGPSGGPFLCSYFSFLGVFLEGSHSANGQTLNFLGLHIE